MPRPNIKIQSARARYNRALGDAVYKARLERGWSLAGLAEACGTSKSTIYYIESGERCPSIHLLDRVAKALETTVDEFLK